MAVDAEDHGLAVDDELLLTVLQRGLNDPGVRLVQSWPRRVKTLTASLEVDLHAVAVELDFVNP